MAASWQNRLTPDEAFKLRTLVSGQPVSVNLLQLHHIAVALAAGSGEGSRIGNTDLPGLLQLAKFMREHPDHTNHAAANAVQLTGYRPEIEDRDYLIARLRKAAERRHWLFSLERLLPDGAPALSTPLEHRIWNRLIQMAPEAIDLFSVLLADARRRGKAEVTLVQQAGRARCEALLAKRLREQLDGVSTQPADDPPRSWFDLIRHDLIEPSS